MAYPTAVNDQITDSVTQSNVGVVGSSPAVAVAQLAQGSAHALALALLNATQAQQQTAITAQAATTASVRTLLGLETQGPRTIEIEKEFHHCEPATEEAEVQAERAERAKPSKSATKPAKASSGS